MQEKLKELLQGYPVWDEVAVQWGEMDAFQHVNSTVYIRWAETARVNYFREMQAHLIDVEGKGIGPILGYIQCKYIFPVTFPDKVITGTHISAFKEDRLKMDHLMVSQHHERVVALIESWIVTYDYQTLRKAPLPAGLEAAIQKYEAQQATG
jgi:acyl-CoA thioester hydrolase